MIFEALGLDPDFLETRQQMILTDQPEILGPDRFSMLLERVEKLLYLVASRLPIAIEQR
jgi:hypothetical protein